MKKLFPLACFAAVCALAQQPRIQNARLDNRQVTGGLEAAMKSIVAATTAPLWAGYAGPIVHGDRNMCCFSNGYARACSLEGRNQIQGNITTGNSAKIEGPRHLVVRYRIEDQPVRNARTFRPAGEHD